MEYLGKKLQAGQLALGSLGSVCCERETRERRAGVELLSCDLGPHPDLTRATEPQQKSMVLLAGVPLVDFGDQHWQGIRLLSLSCMVSRPESVYLALCPISCTKTERKRGHFKSETKTKQDV